ncbi:hypothetical protein HK096_001203 [Nowakowskiella sp. JEL0078]|nr:hypothetical protein HK096_001203 [Nowakowskiella sp. JEL0078]
MARGFFFPKRFPPTWTLKQIAKYSNDKEAKIRRENLSLEPVSVHLLPDVVPTKSFLISTSSHPSQLSPRNNAILRKVAKLADVSLSFKSISKNKDRITLERPKVMLLEETTETKSLLPKGYKNDLERFKRHLKVQENMVKSEEKIAQWKLEKRKLLEKSKPELPF